MDSPETEKELLFTRSTSRDEETQTYISASRRSSPMLTQSLFESLVLSIKSKFFGEDSTLSWFTSTMIMVSLSYGSAVVILPYTMAQLGPVIWILYTFSIILIMAFCTTLLKDCCVNIMDDRKDYTMLRHPYSTIASVVVSGWFGKLVNTFLYVGLVSMGLAFILLGATVMNDIVSLPFTYYGNIRIWLTVVFLVSSPLMMVGTYSNLQAPAIIAVASSTISMICITILSVVAWCQFGYQVKTFEKAPTNPKANFFIIFGDITFAAAGPALALPNIIVFIRNPSKFHYSIIASHIMIFFIYVVCAAVPYSVFGDQITPSVTGTLNDFLKVTGGECSGCSSLLAVCQVCMTTHFILVAVLAMNPVFLSLENHFNVALEFSWKRVLLRSVVLWCMLMFCLLVPYFSPVLSLVGGVPQTLLTVVFPIVIYRNLFDTSPYTRVFLVLLTLLAVVLVIGNAVFSTIEIVTLIMKSFK